MKTVSDEKKRVLTWVKNITVLIFVYLFLFVFNYFTPMGVGDDYLYSFIWQGQPEFIPLTEKAVRVSSLHDLFESQWLHYYTWGGRTVNHTIAQFFLWTGKKWFNYFNSFVGTLLVAEMYWLIHKGKISIDFKPIVVWSIAFALWAFTPGFVTVFLWIEGSCNYLWPTTILIGFLLPYVNHYYSFCEKSQSSFSSSLFMFFLGILSGWTNENSGCWVILFTLILVFRFRKENNTKHWIYTGLLGVIVGYTLLLFAPGNILRLHSTHGIDWFGISIIINNFRTLLTVFTFQVFMWHYYIKTFYSLQKVKQNKAFVIDDLLLVKLFGVMAFGMSAIMIFSPEFPLRSGFPGTVQLIIAVGILLRIQDVNRLNSWDHQRKRILLFVSGVYFLITMVVSLNSLYSLHIQTEEVISLAIQTKKHNSEKVLEIAPFQKPSPLEALFSGFHLIDNELSINENSWENAAFARYYGIKGIRVRQNKQE